MPDAEFSSSILRWAREKRFGPKIDVLREKWKESWTEASPEMVEAWEQGTGQPTFSQIKKLSEIYKRPLAVFFLDSLPNEKANPPDLRTIESKDNKSLSPEALLVIRKARRVQAVAADLFQELGEKPRFKYRQHNIGDDAVELAAHFRAELSVSVVDQFKIRKYEDFFEYLRMKIEDAGVITLKSGLQDSFPVADCRAFSFADQLPFLILVNNKDTEGGKVFSLIHEFAHLLLRTPGICNNFNAFEDRRTVSDIEVFCNRFAASFLVPNDALMDHKMMRGRTSVLPEEIDKLVEPLAIGFKVSRVVILRRFLSRELISLSTYRSKTAEWKKEKPRASKPGGRFSLKTTLARNGIAFSSLVLEAYRKEKLSYASISDYLGVKTKHLPKLETLIDSHAG